MPVLNDRQGISQGWGACRPPGKSDFIKCFIVLDRQKQQLICYNGSSGKTSAQMNPMASVSSMPIVIEFKTDSISLVEECGKIKKRPFCFAVHSLAKITHFSAESWKDMEEWIDCIKESSRITVTQAQLNPNRVSMAGSYTAAVVGGKVIRTPVLEHIAESEPSDCSVESESSDHQSSDSLDCKSLTPSSLIKCGYCVKQGAMLKNWKRRFLKLTPTHLSYFKNEFTTKPIKRIPLKCITNCRVSDSSELTMRSNLIDIITTDRTFYVQFDSVDEMYSWIEEIRKEVNLPVTTYL